MVFLFPIQISSELFSVPVRNIASVCVCVRATVSACKKTDKNLLQKKIAESIARPIYYGICVCSFVRFLRTQIKYANIKRVSLALARLAHWRNDSSIPCPLRIPNMWMSARFWHFSWRKSPKSHYYLLLNYYYSVALVICFDCNTDLQMWSRMIKRQYILGEATAEHGTQHTETVKCDKHKTHN